MGKIKTLRQKDVAYIYYGIRERLAFQELENHMNYQAHMTTDEESNDSWDVIYSDHNSRCIGELKVRKHYSTETLGGRTGEWILEKTKYDALTNSIEGRIVSHIALKPRFIVFFYDCIMIWDLTKIKPSDFIVDKLKNKSVNGEEEYVDKEVVYLKVTDGQKIDFILDYDKLSFNAKTIFKYHYPKNKKDILNI